MVNIHAMMHMMHATTMPNMLDAMLCYVMMFCIVLLATHSEGDTVFGDSPVKPNVGPTPRLLKPHTGASCYFARHARRHVCWGVTNASVTHTTYTPKCRPIPSDSGRSYVLD